MKKVTAKKGKKQAVRGLLREVNVDESLAAILGKDRLPRSEIPTLLWKYIKSHKLQDKADGRVIVADDLLKKIIKKAKISMFDLMSCVNSHVTAD